uniref:Uncharacterized protein n=1 Tax=Aegilops tauschii subsp. strangulata TaxID=200361 RepID=A0A453F958_AEGTS
HLASHTDTGHVATMVPSITLARKSQSFVVPAAPASGETLELSAIDRVPGLRHTVRSLHVFRRNGD